MGDFSVHCCLSGLPITSNQPVVAFGLQKSKFKETNLCGYNFIPTTFPVHGYYDDCGGVTDKDGNDISPNGSIAICHLDFWNALPKFWNKQDGEESLKDSILKAHAKYLEDVSRYKALVDCSNDDNGFWKKRFEDKLWIAHSSIDNNHRCFLKWMDKLYIGEPSSDDGVLYDERKDWSYDKLSGPFEQMILNLIINPNVENFEQICSDLEKLLIAYVSTYIRGQINYAY